MRELKGDWRDLFHGFMLALDPRKMSLGLLGIVSTIVLCGGLTIAWGNSIDREHVVVPRSLILHHWWEAQCQAWDVIYEGPVTTVTADGPARRGKGLNYIPYTALFVFFFISIWAYFGGAISRIAAYEVARDGEPLEIRQALKFSRKRFGSFFCAPVICIIFFLFFAFCCYAGGLFGRGLDAIPVIGFGLPLTAILLPLALLAGFLMALITVGTLAGLPLLVPAVAAEGTDSFDAVSRGFSYVYTRPWHYLWYQIVTWGYGYVCIAFVILFAILLCHLGIAAGGAGFELCGALPDGGFKNVSNLSWQFILSDEHEKMGNYAWDPVSIAAQPHPYGRLQTLGNQIVGDVSTVSAKPLVPGHTIAVFFITTWLAVTLGLSLGYVVSYFFSQQTMIYFILRKKVDGIEMNEVFEEAEEEPSSKPADADAPKPETPPAEPAK